jgi:hypothetical protein
VNVRQFRFRAVITLYPADPHSATPHAASPHYPNHTVALVILARSLRTDNGAARYFPTEIWRDGEAPLQRGSDAMVTVKVTDDLADDFLDVGQQFTLWSGGQVGHGIVCSRVYADDGPP